MKKICLVLMAILMTGMAAWGQKTEKLAIYVTGRLNDEPIDRYAEMSAEMIAMPLFIQNGKYKMISNSNAFKEQVKKEMSSQQSGDVKDEDIAKIGQNHGADKVCVILILGREAKNELKVEARLVDVTSLEAPKSGLAKDYNYDGRGESLDNAVEKAVKDALGIAAFSNGTSDSPGTPPVASGSNIDFLVNGVTFKMVFVKGGTFQMGSYNGDDYEKPVHSVTVSDFYMGEFEVTQALWQEVMGTSVSQQRDNTSWPMYGVGANYPMYYVNHSEAEEFCGRLNQRLRDRLPDGYSFALPTEAEWEYAARGGAKSNAYTYSGGNYLSDMGWFTDNSNESTHAVGMKRANELGLYDMSGNVWEWCADWYGSYSSSSQTDPRGPYSGKSRMIRGGSWTDCASNCRVANRGSCSPSIRASTGGFRLVLVRR